MDKKQAAIAMQQGHKVTNQYFSDHEYLHMVNGKITTEDGYHMDNFWDKDYLPNVLWYKTTN